MYSLFANRVVCLPQGGIAAIQKACEADLGGDVLKSTSLTELHALMANARATLAQGVTYATVSYLHSRLPCPVGTESQGYRDCIEV